MTVPSITLNNGVAIPQLGFGVYQVTPAETVEATVTAFEVGYRHIDTAQMYGNEKQVGEAIRTAGLDRDEVFVTSKLNNGFHAYDDALKAFDGTLAALDSDFVDLFLVHWPCPTSASTTSRRGGRWRGSSPRGSARAVGVSNFQPPHLQRVLDEADDGAGRQPDRGAPVPQPGRGAHVRRRPRHRHRGVVAHRPAARCSTIR